MKFLLKLLKLFIKERYNGASQDTRSPSEKAKDYQHEEFFGYSTAPLEWKEMVLPNYPVRNQDGSGACGPFAASVALGRNSEVENGKYEVLDPAFIYQKRSNKPSPGMNMIELFELMCSVGMPLDTGLSSDNKGDSDLDNKQFTLEQIQDALKRRGKSFIFIRKDIEAIADVINKGHTPIYIVRCQFDEWTENPEVLHPEMKIGVDRFEVNHFNPWPAFGLKDGFKKLASLDSWGTKYGKNGWRFIDQEFIDERVEAVGYVIDLPNLEKPNKPTYKFTKYLTYGLREDKDVVALQDILKYEDCMDKNIPSTGNFLNQTRLGVMKLQRKYKIASEADIKQANGACRKQTIAWLNQNYSLDTQT